jgi:ferritin-like metal-binding protein YciE
MAKASKNSKGTEQALRKLFVDEIKDIYWAEKALVKALSKMQKACTTEELCSAIANHQQETEGHVSRLEDVFALLDEPARGKKCEAMAGLLKEGTEIVEDTEDGTATRDVGIIMASQKVEHYEIATYGCLVQLAKTLGYEKIATILSQTLAEEKRADETLTEIAEKNINYQATEEVER